MKYLLGIGHVNRIDLTDKALHSVIDIKENVFIIDNSSNFEVSKKYRKEGWNIYVPSRPLTFTQTQNKFIKEALNKKVDWYGFMHNDASTEYINEIISYFENTFNNNKNVGILFTNYDAICAIKMEVVKQTGFWDENFAQYYADFDYYHRLNLNGHQNIKNVKMGNYVKHKASQTLHSDIKREIVNKITFPAAQKLWKVKWNGGVFKLAYNNKRIHDIEKNSIINYLNNLLK